MVGDLFIPPSFRPPGTTGPGGNLVGPGSDIFTRGPGYGGDVNDPSLGGVLGGNPQWFGNDPNDLFPSIPGGQPRFGPSGGNNPNNLPRFGPPGGNFGGFGGMGGGFGGGMGGGFGGGGFYS